MATTEHNESSYINTNNTHAYLRTPDTIELQALVSNRLFRINETEITPVDSFVKALQIVAKNPSLLLEMPAAPLEPTPLQQTAMDEWAQKLEFEDYEAFESTSLSGKEFRKSVKVLPRLEYQEPRLKTLADSDSVRLDLLLSRLQIGMEEEIFVTEIEGEAKEYIATFLPELTPHEPTEIIMEGINGHSTSYAGKLRGKHYIYINYLQDFHSEGNIDYFENPYRKLGFLNRDRLLSATIHELIHQGHAEKVGQENFFGLDGDILVNQEIIDEYPTERALQFMYENRHSATKTLNQQLFDIVGEAVATSGEEYILNQIIATRSHEDSFDLRNLLRDLWVIRWKTDDHTYPRNHVKARDMFERLGRQIHAKDIHETMAAIFSIDMKKFGKTSEDKNPDYLTNPLKLLSWKTRLALLRK